MRREAVNYILLAGVRWQMKLSMNNRVANINDMYLVPTVTVDVVAAVVLLFTLTIHTQSNEKGMDT